ncbi:MAG: hypothetical protein HQ521_18380 [Bacteroidetes bacterium]|nr:hypothetical protein [Bacteroidota bacterium]
MSQLEREKTEIPCPGGGRMIKTTYGDLVRRSSLKSSKGHEYKFKSSDQSKFRRAMGKIESLQKDFERDMERAQKEFAEAYQNVIGNADVLLKR